MALTAPNKHIQDTANFIRESHNSPQERILGEHHRWNNRSRATPMVFSKDSSRGWCIFTVSPNLDDRRQHGFFLPEPKIVYVVDSNECASISIRFPGIEENINQIMSVPNNKIRDELFKFRNGVEGNKPSNEIVENAIRIAKAMIESVEHPDMVMDFDGELSFDFRLRDGRLIMAEMEVCGKIDMSIYDSENKFLDRMMDATASEFIEILKQ
ncbi:MAG: hypothetical protein OXL41_12885 [Nitrospinae bacterium]|nr:hypothetical protein [Nitrospinota bacterium]